MSRPAPPPAEPKAIVERAFSYGGLLIRTFHHADAVPSLPLLSLAPDAPSTPEQLPPPKRRRGPWKKKQKTDEASSSSASVVTTPGVQGETVLTPGGTPEGERPLAHVSHIDAAQKPSPSSVGSNSAWIVNEEVYMPEYVRQLTSEELRAVQIRYRKGKLWIPSEVTVMKEAERLRVGKEWRPSEERREAGDHTNGSVRYMQETGCVADVDRFAAEASKLPGVGEVSAEVNCDPFYRMDNGGMDAGMDSVGRDEVWGNGMEVQSVTGGGEYIRSSIQLPPLQSSVVSAENGHDLSLPALSTKISSPDIPTAHSAQATEGSGPVGPTKPNTTSTFGHFPATPSTIPPLPATALMPTPTSNPTNTPDSQQTKRARGRPQGSPLPTSHITSTPAPPTPPSDSKRKRDTSKPTPHHCDSLSTFLAHITSVINSANSGFIPRPVNVSYTLPIPSTEAEYKPSALGIIRDISAIDHFQWTVAHSHWTTSKSKFTAGARWVCNLSEEGMRDRSSRGAQPSGVGGRKSTGSDGTSNARTRYPCNGSIGIRFNTNKSTLTFRYTHHAVHSPPQDLKAQAEAERAEATRKLIATLAEAKDPVVGGVPVGDGDGWV